MPTRLGEYTQRVVERTQAKMPPQENTIDPRIAAAEVMFGNVASSIGQRYHKCSFRNFEANTKPQLSARSQVEQFGKSAARHVLNGKNLFLFGPPGTGKDHLLVATFRMLCLDALNLDVEPRKFRVHWTTGFEMFGAMKHQIRSNDTTTLDACCRAELLVISDPIPPGHNPKLSDWESSMFWKVIDERYRQLKPTWVTLNVTDRKDACARVGAATIDRLAEGACCVHMNWESYRTTKTKSQD